MNPYDGGVIERKKERKEGRGENGDEGREENNRQTISGTKSKSKRELAGQRRLRNAARVPLTHTQHDQGPRRSVHIAVGLLGLVVSMTNRGND